MRFWTKIIVAGIIVLVFLVFVNYIFLALRGKDIIVGQLEFLTGRKVSVGSFKVKLPLNLEIKNLNIEGLLKAESVSISTGILGFLGGNFVLNELKAVKPELTYQRTSIGSSKLFAPPEDESLQPASTAATPPPAPPAPKKIRAIKVIFRRITVQDGSIYFVDNTVGPQGIRIALKDINFSLTNLYLFPRSVMTEFELKARIPWQMGEEQGKITISGWVNLFKKSMQASLKVEDIDGVYLYPYYSKWVDLEKAHIEKAKLNFNSNINGLDNNLTAECRLELADIVFKSHTPEEGEPKEEKIAVAVLSMFKALDQDKIVLNFTIRTKMDRPEFGFGHIKAAVEDKLTQATKGNGGPVIGNLILLPVRLLEGMVKGTTDLSKAVIDGTFSVGNELKKAVQDTFKK